MNNFFKKLKNLLFTESEFDKIHNEILKLKDTPSNYGKVAFMYLKLNSMYGILIGKSDNDQDQINFMWAEVCFKQYQMYRELHLKTINK